MKIVFWTGEAWEPWGPPSLDGGGIGGSETACVHMARAFASFGHEVEVFGQHDGFEGVYDGVTYSHFRRSLEDPRLLDSDVFISSRDKHAIRFNPKASLKILWSHDIHVGDDWEKEIVKYDLIFCLSQFAGKFFQEYYPHLFMELKNRLVVTRNGISTSRFKPEVAGLPAKRPAKFFYSSSPDRGLDVLLHMWPEIKRIRDDAELHVYYGFDTWQRMAARSKNRQNALRIGWFAEKLKNMSSEGIAFHGRVGQAELAEAQMSSTLWLYPTSFLETSCITAMEAQAAGAVPVTTAIGALPETAKHGVLLDGPATSERYRAEFLGMVKGLLGPNSAVREKLALAGRDWAMSSLSWEDVAREWEQIFIERIFARTEAAVTVAMSTGHTPVPER